MSNGRDFEEIVKAAREHYQNLKTDIENAKDRVEHIRLTALAQEAHNLLTDLLVFQTGLVYTHTAEKVHEQRLTNTAGAAIMPANDEPLDLPEFRSPYTPPTQ